MNTDEFLEINKASIEVLGFWREEHMTTIFNLIESCYKKEVTKFWYISGAVINGDSFLLKWNKRILALSDNEIKEKYGK